MTTKDNFEVHTLEYIDKDSKNYRHWSEGLKMYITKNNVTITLNEDEIQQYGYKVVSLIVENRHGSKNVHDCPEETVERMRNRFEISL
jgi:hypothetical protein